MRDFRNEVTLLALKELKSLIGMHKMSEQAKQENPLLSFVASVSGDAYLKVEEDFGQGFCRLKSSEAERRQAKHDIRSVEDIIVELLRNARDAKSSKIFIASANDSGNRSITIIDDGEGVPPVMRDKIFEPRVTSKLETMSLDEWGVHGRGMALYSIRQNTLTAELLDSQSSGGSSFKIVCDTSELKELADQSRWPKVVYENETLKIESGPHNLIRKVAEFALLTPKVQVYLGSPAEIVATLFSLGKSRYKSFAESISHPKEETSIPLWQRLGRAMDANTLVDIATGLGLDISVRNAYRVLRNEIRPVQTVVEMLSRGTEHEPAAVDIYKDARGLKLDKTDLSGFQIELEAVFDDLAKKYFISLSEDIKVKVLKDSIKVTFPFERE